MIKRLRIKFIAVTMGVLAFVFLTVFAAINIFMILDSIQKTDSFLEEVARKDGNIFTNNKKYNEARSSDGNGFEKGGFSGSHARMSRFFYVKTDEAYQVSEMDYSQMYDITQEEVLKNVSQVTGKGEHKGSLGNMQYLVHKTDYGYIVVFAEKSYEIGMLGSLLSVSLWAAGISCGLLAVFVFFLSKWIVGPVQKAFDRQKQFISDASHELKTPLTIISANADVLENEIGENIRVTHIKNQTARMGGLIRDLLELARADEGRVKPTFYRFDLSQAVLGATLEFESRAFEERKKLSYYVQENVSYQGDEASLRQLCTILVDNALQHSDNAGEVYVSLSYEGGNRIILSVSNTGSEISEEDLSRIFERFYRSDSSRSRETGGYGLGLAIAKSIVELHGGKIDVHMDRERGVVFRVLL